jgi:hypothetical protein
MGSHRHDADSFLIAIDNCTSGCIIKNWKDFLADVVSINIPVRGIGGTVKAILKGTVEQLIKDDNRVAPIFRIKDVCLNEGSPYRLLSLQQWAQSRSDHFPKKRGTWCAMCDDAVELFWAQRTHKRTVKLSPSSNITLTGSAPSNSIFNACCTQISSIAGEPIDETELLALPAAAQVSDDESSDDEPEMDVDDNFLMPDDGQHPDLLINIPVERKEAADFQERVTEAILKGMNIAEIESKDLPKHDHLMFSTPLADMLAWHFFV